MNRRNRNILQFFSKWKSSEEDQLIAGASSCPESTVVQLQPLPIHSLNSGSLLHEKDFQQVTEDVLGTLSLEVVLPLAPEDTGKKR